MNYKTMLLASVAVLFASQAMAQDLTGAFSVPGKGQISSDTRIAMSREKTKFNKIKYIEDGVTASEFVEYGITDKFSVNAGIENTFDVEGYYNNDHNFAYTLGAKYNTRFDDVLFQVSGRYNTFNTKEWYGRKERVGGARVYNRWEKALGFDLKAGLDLGNGITPYAVYSFDSIIDKSHRPIIQSVSAGIHKYTGKWAFDGAVRYEWSKGNGPKNSTETWFDGAVDYYLKDNVALGVYGSYLIDAHDKTYSVGKEHTNFAYEAGLRAKVLF
ncbi:hypothetical protein IJ556_03580 [bacterium]|nr:hypothetical protein [bacterium]MBR2274158.1 hypothetical protein [Alphaproteobacteria bacterium]